MNKKIYLLIIILFLIGFLSSFFIKAGFTIKQIVSSETEPNSEWSEEDLPELPTDDPNRINILILGIRDLEDGGEGFFLSDAMIVLSIDQASGQVALISIPRDIYLQTWCHQDKKKINFAYAYGGFDCAKKTVSYLSGLYIDYALSGNFVALEQIIDTLGGITVNLEKPFEEKFQWAKEGQEDDERWKIEEVGGEEKWVFHLPAGENELDGEMALYYVRSRFSSNDFDRMSRQQKVLLAVKEKAFSLGVLANPLKIYQLLDILGANIRTDIQLAQLDKFIDLIPGLETEAIKKLVIQNGPEGLLYQTFINDEYVLLPQGDNFDKIQTACQNIFN